MSGTTNGKAPVVGVPADFGAQQGRGVLTESSQSGKSPAARK